MYLKDIKKKQNVNASNSDSSATDDDNITLERELPRYLKNIIHRVFEVPKQDRDKVCEVVPMADLGMVTQLEMLVDSGRGKPERLRYLISKYYQQTGDIYQALDKAKEVYEQEIKYLDGIGHKGPGLEDTGPGIEEHER